MLISDTKRNGREITAQRYLIRPNCSMTWRNTLRLYWLVCVATLLIAIGFALVGLWMIVPFMGLELIVLAIAFYVVACKAKNYEQIVVSANRLSVHRQLFACSVERIDIERYWLKIELVDAQKKNHGNQLFLCSHGRKLEVATLLSDDERLMFAKELARAVQTDMNSVCNNKVLTINNQ